MKSSTKKNVTLLGVGAALCLATAASLGAMSVGKASAAELSNDGENSGTTTVTYTAGDEWTVTIPDTINIAAPSEDTDKVVASGVKIGAEETLTVTVESTNGWELRKAGQEEGGLKYTLKANGGEALTNGGTVLTVTSSANNGEATLAAELTGGNVSTGGEAYTDTLTFDVNVE